MFQYDVNVKKIIDGDTVSVDIFAGFNIWILDEKIRIKGIDTPESRSSDKIEKLFGLASKKRLSELLENKVRLITDTKKGKFGRVLGDFALSSGEMVSDILINECFAVKYDGQSKDLLRELHLRNRQFLIRKGIVTI